MKKSVLAFGKHKHAQSFSHEQYYFFTFNNNSINKKLKNTNITTVIKK